MSNLPDLATIATLDDLKTQFEDRIPLHVGLILDGNRRWIRRQGINDPTQGHLAGYKTLKKILYPFFEVGVKYLSVYALSSENVRKRSDTELNFLFKLILKGVQDVLEEPLIHEKKVRVRLIGHLNELDTDTQNAIKHMNNVTAEYNDCFINFCVLYDGQEELVDAMKKIQLKQISPPEISKQTIKENLYTAEFPELDYIIRTGMDDGARISGFLLWDSSYAEFRFRNELWPDYNEGMVLEDIKEFIRRNRRKGK